MSQIIPVFKPWVPEWLLRLTLLLVILPGLLLFVLSICNVNAAAGYYGISPNDVNYSCIIFYAAMASFVVLESRFFRYIACKEYLIILMLLLMLSCYLCYLTRSFPVLLVLRYIQGLLTCGTLSVNMNLMFSRLHSDRSREIGYSVVYCILLSVMPLSTILSVPIVDNFNFNVVYKAAMYSFLPGSVLMFFFMNNVRLNRKFPLYSLDWASFFFYSSGFCLFGYMAIYGQQLEWFDDKSIVAAFFTLITLICLFAVRQKSAKRPYLYLSVLKISQFRIAAALLFVLYICRGSFGVTTTFMATTLGMDPQNISYLLFYNITAIVISVTIASRLVLQKKPLRLILLYGFTILLVFHALMCFLFSTQLDAVDLIIPVILQGLGAGMLMAPIILFLVSCSPAQYGNTGSGIGILIRFTGFCTSIALINYFQLERQRDHFNRFQEQLAVSPQVLLDRISATKFSILTKGQPDDKAAAIAYKMAEKSVSAQAQIRYAMDYYQLVSYLLIVIILAVILLPTIKSTISRKIRKEAPVIY